MELALKTIRVLNILHKFGPPKNGVKLIPALAKIHKNLFWKEKVENFASRNWTEFRFWLTFSN